MSGYFPEGVVYGDGTYVAVGLSGTIVTSNDGTNWTTPASPTIVHLNGVTYGDGMFVAVGDYGAVDLSTDGVNWTHRLLDITLDFHSVTYGNGIYVAVGVSETGTGIMMTSSNGADWTSRTLDHTNSLHGVTYGNGTFVAVGEYGLTLTSSDGVSWTSHSMETFSHFNSVAYGNGTFVAVGNDGAIWQYGNPSPQTYTVTYNGNGSTGGTVPTDSGVYEQNAMATVLGNAGSLVKTGHTFTGWNTAADGSGTSYAANATFAMGASNVTLYAQWTEIPAVPTFTVTYNGNGSTGGRVPTDRGAYEQNATVAIFGNTGSLVKTGHTFTGWNTAADGSEASYASGAALTIGAANVTLYAQWTVIPSGGSGGSSGSSGSSGSGGGGIPTPDNSKVIAENGKLVLPVGRSGEVRLDEGIKIDIPANATEKELILTIERVLNTQSLLTKNEVLASPVYEVLKNFTENFKKPVTLTLTFDPAKLKDNQRAAIFYYDEGKKGWVEIGGIVKGNQISVEVDHFTKYAVLAVDKPSNEEVKLSDISGHWAEANIIQAVKDGVARGYPDGTFKPNHTVMRAEFAVMLMNALKLEGEAGALTFKDNTKIAVWAQQAIAQAVEAGIIKGYADDTFRPEAAITRAEMAAMIANALKLTLEENAATGFADEQSIPTWARGAAAAMKELGIMEGTGANAFHSAAQSTRAEAVTVLLRMLAK
ncbi:S-layer homology domain-containing protein [Paenibacillus algorifonticola]|uniref:S-layer homology domain-containing protein n=1 Tax=Paenibacillus algorifonticola TaxID=684063 RepID=UPI000695E912|nr:S-layer homology domain-containing protein [Paenibacillus algorifonticola]